MRFDRLTVSVCEAYNVSEGTVRVSVREVPMARRFRKEDVETHSDGFRPSLPAVNVKVYGSWTDQDAAEVLAENASTDERFSVEWLEEREDELSWLFWEACSSGWEMIEQDAEEIFGGGVKVSAEGRQGGWAVVDGLPDLEQWDAVMVAKWAKFRRYARAEAENVPRAMVSIAYINAFEPWAAEQDNPARLTDARDAVCYSCLSAVSA